MLVLLSLLFCCWFFVCVLFGFAVVVGSFNDDEVVVVMFVK